MSKKEKLKCDKVADLIVPAARNMAKKLYFGGPEIQITQDRLTELNNAILGGKVLIEDLLASCDTEYSSGGMSKYTYTINVGLTGYLTELLYMWLMNMRTYVSASLDMRVPDNLRGELTKYLNSILLLCDIYNHIRDYVDNSDSEKFKDISEKIQQLKIDRLQIDEPTLVNMTMHSVSEVVFKAIRYIQQILCLVNVSKGDINETD